jgi:hypothetical protein
MTNSTGPARAAHETRCVSTMVEKKARQADKIREIGLTLIKLGFPTLDMQARVLGLARSTTWTILKASHKSSGLSASTIVRILSNPKLPTELRLKVLDYVREKEAGLYGDSQTKLRRFTARVSHANLVIDDVRDPEMRGRRRQRLQTAR